jgi:putative transposase
MTNEPRSGDSDCVEWKRMSFTCLNYHLVFSTKHRKPVIDDAIRERLYEYIGGIIRAKEGRQIEIGGVADHIHILAGCSPKVAVADWVRDIKANSARWMNEFSERQTRFEWQKGYGAFTVSVSQVEIVRNYIQRQPEHHQRQTFQEEFVELLKRHGIEFDPHYVFEEEHHG